ncbi:MAG: hypothetical protein M1820_002018 [Bogoriella megaspora]|nr:MAG: hypothetical protein M1820_002018 [Bogoriella megaspora]
MQELDLLILGAGWTSQFLIPLLSRQGLTYAATTRSGSDNTIPFTFDPDQPLDAQLSIFKTLPQARVVLITFPLKSAGSSKLLIDSYNTTHDAHKHNHRFIQLGSTGIWQIPEATNDSYWVTRHSTYDTENSRAIAEDELRRLGGCVLNLAGLWGGERQPRNWVDRIARSKEDVRGKGSLHMIHGVDVARAIIAVMSHWDRAAGERWMLTDGFVYDFWALFAAGYPIIGL